MGDGNIAFNFSFYFGMDWLRDGLGPAWSQYSKSIRLSSLKGQVVVLTFAFAHCSTVCPTLVYQVKSAVEESKSTTAKMLIVTLDPWRDTPGALPTLAEQWNLPSFAHVLSGDVKKVQDAIASFKIPATRDESTGDVVHPALVYILNQEGEVAYTFNGAPTRWLVQAIGRLENIGRATVTNN